MSLIIDAHQDLAYNILTFQRNYLRAAAETRQIEKGTTTPERNSQTLLGWPDYQRGQVAVVFSTLFITPRRYISGAWETENYLTFDDAHRLHQRQVDVYRRLCDEAPNQFRLIYNQSDLQTVLKPWDAAPANPPDVTHPVGLVQLMEGAEGVRSTAELEEWWAAGVRIIGLVWAGNRLCGGTMEPGPFTREGLELIEAMADLGFTLDISHMSEESALTALDRYQGPVIATHANARALLRNPQNERHFTDQTIRRLFERGGVMGVIPYNRFLKLDWTLADGRHAVTLKDLVDQIDYLCQLAGDARHVGLGTDFDGGFGWPSVPEEIDTIADLQKIGPLLLARGFAPEDVDAILGSNWRRFLEENLPE